MQRLVNNVDITTTTTGDKLYDANTQESFTNFNLDRRVRRFVFPKKFITQDENVNEYYLIMK